MRKLLVTGANGFLGKAVVRKLEGKGYAVHAVSRDYSGKGTETCQWHSADLLSKTQVARLISRVRPEVILHMAWFTDPRKFWESPDNLLWVDASRELVRCAIEFGSQSVITAGTCAEYFGGTIYGAAKRAMALESSELCRSAGISHSHARIYFPYGMGEHPKKLISSLLEDAITGRNKFIIEYPDAVRDYIHVQNVADSLVELLKSNYSGTVDVGTGVGTRVADIQSIIDGTVRRYIGDGLSSNIRCDFQSTPMPVPNSIVADTTQLSKIIDVTKFMTLEDGLISMIKTMLHVD